MKNKIHLTIFEDFTNFSNLAGGKNGRDRPKKKTGLGRLAPNLMTLLGQFVFFLSISAAPEVIGSSRFRQDCWHLFCRRFVLPWLFRQAVLIEGKLLGTRLMAMIEYEINNMIIDSIFCWTVFVFPRGGEIKDSSTIQRSIFLQNFHEMLDIFRCFSYD